MIKKITVLVTVFLFAMTSVSSAAENQSWIDKIKSRFQKKDSVKAAKPIAPAPEKKPAGPPPKKRKDMTKTELAADIKKNLEQEDSIMNMVPGLEKKADPDGKEYYSYQGTRLEDLDKDTLDKIFGRVRNEALRLRTDKLNRQIETVRRASAVTVAAPRVPAPPPVPPAVSNVPNTSREAQPPSRPAAPPAPPRR